ncbi:MAG: PIG-L family deacetylase [Oscillospiraceae bacterium]|nr:PIG-L family deacetylase [Oscillospiraceae bacterium]
MSLLKKIIRAAAPLPKIGEQERFLFIGPHPDDIEIGAGATAAKLAAEGKTICFLICADGRFGTSNSPDIGPEEMTEIRKQEAIESARFLGVEDVRLLGLCDGGFYKKKELVRGIAGVIGEFRPDVVFAPDPCVTSECHKDHLNVGNAAREVAVFAPYAGIMKEYGAEAAPVKALAYFFTAKANSYVDTSGYLPAQLDSIFKYHRSQFPEGCADAKSISLYLKLRAYDFGLRSFHKTAEGFRVLGRTQMHCLPEAGD